MATEEWNAKGGIKGQKIDLIVEDTGNSAAMAVTALDRVLGQKPCAILATPLSFQLYAMFPEIMKEKIPTFSNSGTRELTQKGNLYYFRTYPHDGISKRALTVYAVQELKAKKVALMCVTTEFGKSGHEIIANTLKEYGIKPVVETWHNNEDKDMTGQLMTVKRADPDVIISAGHPPDIAVLLKQQYELGIKVPHLAPSSAEMPYVHDLVGAGMDGVYIEVAALPSFDPDPKIQEWIKRYTERFGMSPDAYSFLHYDTAHLLLNAIQAVGPDREKIAEHLRKMRYQGLAGTYAFDKEQNGVHFAIIAQYKLKDGKAIPTVKKKYDFTPK